MKEENNKEFILQQKKLKILVVEDDAASAEYLNLVLDDINATVAFATTGESALEIFKSNQEFDLILMDIQMPDISGYEITRIIRKIDPKIPIIAQTAFALDEDRKKCIEAGCNDYIAKPIASENLYSLIEKVLSKS